MPELASVARTPVAGLRARRAHVPPGPATASFGAAAQRKQWQAHAERDECLRVLTECGGDRVLASQKLGISRTTLWRKLKDGA